MYRAIIPYKQTACCVFYAHVHCVHERLATGRIGGSNFFIGEVRSFYFVFFVQNLTGCCENARRYVTVISSTIFIKCFFYSYFLTLIGSDF